MKAAARSYFGKELGRADAGRGGDPRRRCRKSPSNYDLVRNAIEELRRRARKSEGACPAADEPPHRPDRTPTSLERRDQILELMADDRTPMSDGRVHASRAQPRTRASRVELARADGAALAGAAFRVGRARRAHAQAVRRGHRDRATQLDDGGLRVITTTLDLELQKIAEKWVKGATIVPAPRGQPTGGCRQGASASTRTSPGCAISRTRTSATAPSSRWTTRPASSSPTSARPSYYATSEPTRVPAPVRRGRRRASASRVRRSSRSTTSSASTTGRITAGDMLMDVAPTSAAATPRTTPTTSSAARCDCANALQFSLNIPSVKAMALNTPEHMFARAKDFGMTFQSDTTDAGLALALGVAETRPVDLVVRLRHARPMAAGGSDRRRSSRSRTAAGKARRGAVHAARRRRRWSARRRPTSSPTSWPATPTAGSTRSGASSAVEGPGGDRRPATLKTGTNNDAKDLNAYGYIAPPTEAGRADGAYALSVGAWNGNSDNTPVSTPVDPSSRSTSRRTSGRASCRRPAPKWEITQLRATGRWPDPGRDRPVHRAAARRRQRGRRGVVHRRQRRPTPASTATRAANRCCRSPATKTSSTTGWTRTATGCARAEQGPGTAGGPDNTRVTYFYNNQFNPYGRTWGVLVGGDGCGSPSPSPSCFVVPTPDASGVIPSFALPVADG